MDHALHAVQILDQNQIDPKCIEWAFLVQMIVLDNHIVIDSWFEVDSNSIDLYLHICFGSACLEVLFHDS